MPPFSEAHGWKIVVFSCARKTTGKLPKDLPRSIVKKEDNK
jgi:hypothetical protein